MRSWCEISIPAYLAFFKKARLTAGPRTQLLAVVKANAYGLGAVPLAQALARHDAVDYLAVATPSEGATLRSAGIKLPILLLSECQPEERALLFENNLTAVVYSSDYIQNLEAEAQRLNQTLGVHLKIDTGMNRLGCKSEDALELTHQIQATSQLRLEGVMTHFSAADETHPLNEIQLRRFNDVLLHFSSQPNLLIHSANSAAFEHLEGSYFSMVRLGISSFEPIVSIKSRVLYLKEVKAGEGISYGATYVTKIDTKIATVCMGYADGIPRSFKGFVLIRGQKFPVVGRICMDLLMVDIGPHSSVEKWDEVTFVGAQGNEKISIQEFAAYSGRITYESLCALGPRVQRVYQEASN